MNAIPVMCAPAAPGRFARKQCEEGPEARQRPLPDAEIRGGEVSLITSSACARYHAKLGKSVTDFTVVRPRNGALFFRSAKCRSWPRLCEKGFI